MISGLTAGKYLKCSKAEFESLVKQGIIQAHRDEEMRWRVSKKSILDYIKGTQTEEGFSYIADEEHYTEVFRRMTEVKRSLKIATGDLKNFNVTIERDGGEEKLVWGESMTQALLNHFEKAWNDPDILKHTWKRFATKAKEFLRKD